MEQKKKNSGIFWLFFLIFSAAFVWAIAAHFEYVMLILPFVGTFFVKALDII